MMAVMLWPGGLGLPMTELNWFLLLPATFVQFWAGGDLRARGLAPGAPRHA